MIRTCVVVLGLCLDLCPLGLHAHATQGRAVRPFACASWCNVHTATSTSGNTVSIEAEDCGGFCNNIRTESYAPGTIFAGGTWHTRTNNWAQLAVSTGGPPPVQANTSYVDTGAVSCTPGASYQAVQQSYYVGAQVLLATASYHMC
jgi:hypothetical protein